MAETIDVLVVDDSPFIRRAVQRMLEPLPDVRVVGTAANGREAVDQVRRLRPDLVILDIVMPEVDGLEAIRRIMSTEPSKILVLSSHARPGAEVTLKALELGAVDFVSKSDAGTRMDIYDLAPVLREKVMAVAGSRVPSAVEDSDGPQPPATPARGAATSTFELLVLGASTGGPRALAAILSALPADFPAGVVVAQHMPPGFTGTLAERLNRRSRLEVREAQDGDAVRPGLVLVGVGGKQIRLERKKGKLVVRIPGEPDTLLHRPSVDLLLKSAAEAAGPTTVGVVLTGMGQDGAKGLAALREAGGRTLTESEDSAVIFGMPRAAAEHADRVLPLGALPRAIVDVISGGGD